MKKEDNEERFLQDLLDRFCKMHGLSLQRTAQESKTSNEIVRVGPVSNPTEQTCVCYSNLGDCAYLSSCTSSFEMDVKSIIHLILRHDRIAWTDGSGKTNIIDMSNVNTIEELEIYCDLYQDHV